jgi:multiple sugar transport system ATP-binding protein
VREAARTLDLEGLLDRKPRRLSGGQRQRVAMGRAIVRQPSAFLMDEPLSNLDAKLRVHMRSELARLQDRLGVTTVYVTHDQVEAMTMGDRVAVMRRGELQQVEAPEDLYDHPVNLFVGGFIGSPSMNMFRARLERSDDELVARLGSQSLTLGPESLSGRDAVAAYENRDVIVGIRPEDIQDAAFAGDAPPGRRLRGRVELREALGAEVLVHLAIDARPAVTDEMRELASDVGVEAPAAEQTEAIAVARFARRSRVRVGQIVEAVVDTSGLHFFDPETRLGIYDRATEGALA